MSVVWGQLESDRAVPDARYFAWQLSFKPLPNLELGLERSAQWCGSGRPCDAGIFFDLLAGNDNRGDAGIEPGNEPGNQLAGIHGRWSSPRANWPLALYFQLTGEDEASGLPSKLLGLLGVEHWGGWGSGWTYRVRFEAADTTCSFLDHPGEFDCAYNHSIYRTGYRYRGRSIGHAVEQDARSLSFGMVALSGTGALWQGRILHAELNRGGAPDARNTVTATPLNLTSLEVSHQRDSPWGRFFVGLGLDRLGDNAPAGARDDVRGFVRWERVF
jgi:hypothetical protein